MDECAVNSNSLTCIAVMTHRPVSLNCYIVQLSLVGEEIVKGLSEK